MAISRDQGQPELVAKASFGGRAGVAPNGNLQGELLRKVVEELADPETEVVRWSIDEKTRE